MPEFQGYCSDVRETATVIRVFCRSQCGSNACVWVVHQYKKARIMKDMQRVVGNALKRRGCFLSCQCESTISGSEHHIVRKFSTDSPLMTMLAQRNLSVTVRLNCVKEG